MTHTRSQLISALANEWEYLCHESPEDDDMSAAEYLDYVHSLTDAQLIDESGSDNIDEYIALYS